jgi:hypothetical protein
MSARAGPSPVVSTGAPTSDLRRSNTAVAFRERPVGAARCSNRSDARFRCLRPISRSLPLRSSRSRLLSRRLGWRYRIGDIPAATAQAPRVPSEVSAQERPNGLLHMQQGDSGGRLFVPPIGDDRASVSACELLAPVPTGSSRLISLSARSGAPVESTPISAARGKQVRQQLPPMRNARGR